MMRAVCMIASICSVDLFDPFDHFEVFDPFDVPNQPIPRQKTLPMILNPSPVV
jgi:hypothetical protein